jgi:predicted signal transduction protein with EAL and GGDEF domain
MGSSRLNDTWRCMADPIPDRDELTGLASRQAARAWLEARIAGDAGPLPLHACILVGISQFASVNAAYGHQMGDRILLSGGRGHPHAIVRMRWTSTA